MPLQDIMIYLTCPVTYVTQLLLLSFIRLHAYLHLDSYNFYCIRKTDPTKIRQNNELSLLLLKSYVLKSHFPSAKTLFSLYIYIFETYSSA